VREGYSVPSCRRCTARAVRAISDSISRSIIPRMASMEVDPELSDTLMHLSGYIFRAAINAAIRKG